MLSAGVLKSFNIRGGCFITWGEWSLTPPSFSLRLNTGICLKEVFDLYYYSVVILSRNWSNSLSFNRCLASRSSFFRSIYYSNTRCLAGEITRFLLVLFEVSNLWSQFITSFSVGGLGGDLMTFSFYSSLKLRTLTLSDRRIRGGTVTFMRPLSSKVRNRHLLNMFLAIILSYVTYVCAPKVLVCRQYRATLHSFCIFYCINESCLS